MVLDTIVVMRNTVGRFAARWGMLLFATVVGGGVLLLGASLLVGKNLDAPDRNTPAVVSSEGRYTIGDTPSSCPEDVSSCQKITVPAGETVLIEKIIATLGVTAVNGEAPDALRRVADGWEIDLPSTTATLLITAGDKVWLLSTT